MTNIFRYIVQLTIILNLKYLSNLKKRQIERYYLKKLKQADIQNNKIKHETTTNLQSLKKKTLNLKPEIKLNQ